MTTREILLALGQSPTLLALMLGGPSLLAIVLGWLHPRGKGGRGPVKYGYSLAVYSACIFGVAALVIDAYTLAFTRENLLDANFLVTIAPIVAMVTTLGLVSRNVDFRALPGFDRLSGLVLMLAATFASVILVSKTNFVVLFHGSFWNLVLVAVGVFLMLKFGTHLMFRRKPQR